MQTLNLNIDSELSRVNRFLYYNYHDTDNKFILYYDKNFIKWIYNNYGKYHDDLAIGYFENGELLGFLLAYIVEISINGKIEKIPEINFLCVDTEHRNKKIAENLIIEFTKRANTLNYYVAIYTSSIQSNYLVGIANYYHRPLDYKFLVESGFYDMTSDYMTKRNLKLFQLSTISKLEEYNDEYLESCFNLLNLKKFELHEIFDKEQFKKILNCPFITTLVLKENDIIIGFSCYYHYNLINKINRKIVNIAQLYYYGIIDNNKLTFLIKHTMIIAKKRGFHVFNCLNIMDNNLFIKDLHFDLGNSNLDYYINPKEFKKHLTIGKILF